MIKDVEVGCMKTILRLELVSNVKDTDACVMSKFFFLDLKWMS